MPIGTDRSTALQVAPVASIGQEPITPAVQDFMQGFRSGFITVDDITKRAGEAVVRPSEIELRQKQNEQGILDTETIRPQQRELTARKLAADINNAELVAQIASLKLKQDQQNQVNAGIMIPPEQTARDLAVAKDKETQDAIARVGGDITKQTTVFNADQQTALLGDFAKTVGQIPPDITVTKPVTPKPIEQWSAENPGRPASEYVAYQKEAQVGRPTVVKQGEPEYFQELQEQLTKRKNELAQAATAQSIAGPLALQDAKLKAEAPALAQKLVGDLKTEMGNNKELSLAVLSDRAFANAKALANKPNPTNQDDIGLTYATVKSFDPNAVREGEIKLFQQGIGFPGQAQLLYNRVSGNKNAVLRPQERKNISDLIDLLQETSNQSTLPVLRTYFNRAVAGNAPLNQVFDSNQLKLLISNPSGAVPAPTGTPAAGAVGASQKIQNGYLYERQPDGTYKGIRKL